MESSGSLQAIKWLIGFKKNVQKEITDITNYSTFVVWVAHFSFSLIKTTSLALVWFFQCTNFNSSFSISFPNLLTSILVFVGA